MPITSCGRWRTGTLIGYFFVGPLTADSESLQKYPGHLRNQPSLIRSAIDLLLLKYDAYEPFSDSCRSIKPALADLTDELGNPFRDTYREVADLMQGLAHCWNLDRIPDISEGDFMHLRWAVHGLDTRIGNTLCGVFSPLGIGYAAFEVDMPEVKYKHLTWSWDPESDGSLSNFRRRIMNDLSVDRPSDLPEEVSQLVASYAEQAQHLGARLSDLPSSLPKHIHWLFRRLCPQPDQVWGWERIATEERERAEEFVVADTRTISRRVIGIANDTEIKLPVLPRGRPPKI